ncbi:unnamed protein product [Meloidogyne enterolobii]|uniref:Uncharacterized protein n=1 Tax=Meloidogyne enterolobii TaxID=390850 RepID=A0ACB0Z734_MELEN
MKIYNLILLNFCFLQFISISFGMNREGPSGSQQPRGRNVCIIVTKFNKQKILIGFYSIERTNSSFA